MSRNHREDGEPVVAESPIGTVEDVTGNIVCIDASCVTIGNQDGSHHSLGIAPDAVVKLNEADATVADLKAGDTVSLTGDPVTSITAIRG